MVTATIDIRAKLDAIVLKLPLVATSIDLFLPQRLRRSTMSQASQTPRLHTSSTGHGGAPTNAEFWLGGG